MQQLLEDKGEEFLYMVDDWLADKEREAGREDTDTVRLGVGLYPLDPVDVRGCDRDGLEERDGDRRLLRVLDRNTGG